MLPGADGDASVSGSQALDHLREQMRVRHGPISAIEGKAFFDDQSFVLGRDEFTFETEHGVHFHYRTGEGVTAQVPDNAMAREDLEIFLWGTVYGAVAWLNGMLPLHASAIARDGLAIAFTADAGGGKSTLAAGLAKTGWSHLCDDTLVLAHSDSGPIALPDAKPMKLWEDALSLLDLTGEHPIRAVPGKHFVAPSNAATKPALLRDLVFIEEGDHLAMEPIRGRAKLERLPEAMYRRFVHLAHSDDTAHGRWMVSMADSVRFWRLSRPKSRDGFDEQLQAIAELMEASEIGGTP